MLWFMRKRPPGKRGRRHVADRRRAGGGQGSPRRSLRRHGRACPRRAGGDRGGASARRGGADIAAARRGPGRPDRETQHRSEEHTSELQSLMRNSYAVFCLKKKKKH